jgi:hypothetical protein
MRRSISSSVGRRSRGVDFPMTSFFVRNGFASLIALSLYRSSHAEPAYLSTPPMYMTSWPTVAAEAV